MKNHHMSKPAILSTVAAIATCSALLSGVPTASAATSANKATPITVAYMPTVGAMGLAIAEHLGYFKEAGLSVTLDSFQTGPAEIDAMASGRIDMGYIGPGAIFLLMKGAAKGVMIDSLSMGEAIIASKKSGIRTAKGLKGKSILVPEGTTAEVILYEALKSAGLSLNDVNMINIIPTAEAAAFLSNRAPVMSGWSPNTTEALDRSPGAKVIATDRTFYPAMSLPNIWVASNSFAQHDPSVIKRYLWAILQADNFASHHPRAALHWTSTLTGVPLKKLTESWSTVKWLTKSEILNDARSGAASRWLSNLGRTFVAMKELSDSPNTSVYSRLDWTLQAAK